MSQTLAHRCKCLPFCGLAISCNEDDIRFFINAGAVPLELIEVQTGSYFGEVDIVRFDDDYGR